MHRFSPSPWTASYHRPGAPSHGIWRLLEPWGESPQKLSFFQRGWRNDHALHVDKGVDIPAEGRATRSEHCRNTLKRPLSYSARPLPHMSRRNSSHTRHSLRDRNRQWSPSSSTRLSSLPPPTEVDQITDPQSRCNLPAAHPANLQLEQTTGNKSQLTTAVYVMCPNNVSICSPDTRWRRNNHRTHPLRGRQQRFSPSRMTPRTSTWEEAYRSSWQTRPNWRNCSTVLDRSSSASLREGDRNPKLSM